MKFVLIGLGGGMLSNFAIYAMLRDSLKYHGHIQLTLGLVGFALLSWGLVQKAPHSLNSGGTEQQ